MYYVHFTVKYVTYNTLYVIIVIENLNIYNKSTDLVLKGYLFIYWGTIDL